MNITDLNHLEIVKEAKVEGGRGGFRRFFPTSVANAEAEADSIAYGWGAKAFTYTETDTIAQPGYAAASSTSASHASVGY